VLLDRVHYILRDFVALLLCKLLAHPRHAWRARINAKVML
jgi:hypothetical protein